MLDVFEDRWARLLCLFAAFREGARGCPDVRRADLACKGKGMWIVSRWAAYVCVCVCVCACACVCVCVCACACVYSWRSPAPAVCVCILGVLPHLPSLCVFLAFSHTCRASTARHRRLRDLEACICANRGRKVIRGEGGREGERQKEGDRKRKQDEEGSCKVIWDALKGSHRPTPVACS